jgi:hypothetical protein
MSVEQKVQHLQSVVTELQRKLSLDATVIVSIVPRNALMMSVEPLAGDRQFSLSIDQAFLADLSDSEIEAALAHELGHVWVFTHHPFLQTEQLANDIAMRVVDRQTLVRVYDKVWRAEGVQNVDVHRYLGSDPAAPTDEARAARPID